ncbi:hypothetical protein PG989_015702 [Apiospora arundinis]
MEEANNSSIETTCGRNLPTRRRLSLDVPREKPRPPQQFRRFPSLPPELRRMIWGWILGQEQETRRLASSYRGIKPTRSLASPLLVLNRESRSLALRRYPNTLRVYRQKYATWYCWKVQQIGAVHINWHNDTMRLEGGVKPLRIESGPERSVWAPALGKWLFQSEEHCCRHSDLSLGEIRFDPWRLMWHFFKNKRPRGQWPNEEELEESYLAIRDLF